MSSPPESNAGAMPIDAVVAWVDGNDPRHRAKLDRYLVGMQRAPSGAAATRFRSVGEIDYCIASLLRFAPFLRRIHIITDEQVPAVIDRLRQAGLTDPDRVVVVDHRDLFAGHEAALPTFNSRAIETMLHRVPGLAEHFVYLNDDFFLIRPLRPEDWFRAGQPVIRGRWRPLPERSVQVRVRQALRWLIGRGGAPARASHVGAQACAARLAGFDQRFLVLEHTPHAMRRETLARHFAAHPQQLEENIAHRLRSPSQFLTTVLAAHLEIAAGTACIEADPRLVYVKPGTTARQRVARHLKRAEDDRNLLFACVQSLDQATPAAQQQVIDWLDRMIGPPAGAAV